MPFFTAGNAEVQLRLRDNGLAEFSLKKCLFDQSAKHAEWAVGFLSDQRS